MPSGDLIPSDHDLSEPASSEVQFALVIARMIDTVRNSPEDMRQAVYDLARYKLQEQFTYADAKDIRRTEQALESAIRGVEAFSKQQPGLAAPPPQISEVPPAPAPHMLPPPEWIQRSEAGARPRLEADSAAGVRASSFARAPRPWRHARRIAILVAVLLFLLGSLVAVQQRGRLALLLRPPDSARPTAVATPQPPAPVAAAPAPVPAKPAPPRPTDYGVYAISNNDALIELELLPGRAPDLRVAVSAAIKTPSVAILPNGHPKFIVFRRDVSSVADRADVRIIAKVAREFSPEIAGKKPAEGDETWVIRNVAFPFRTTPVEDNPEMVELHSEDPALELTPGRYALVLKNQSYDFTVAGAVVDPRQCIERIVSTNGTYYSDCKKP
jgi:hypothetical protein